MLKGTFPTNTWAVLESFADWRSERVAKDAEFYKLPIAEQVRMWQEFIDSNREEGTA